MHLHDMDRLFSVLSAKIEDMQLFRTSIIVKKHYKTGMHIYEREAHYRETLILRQN